MKAGTFTSEDTPAVVFGRSGLTAVNVPDDFYSELKKHAKAIYRGDVEWGMDWDGSSYRWWVRPLAKRKRTRRELPPLHKRVRTLTRSLVSQGFNVPKMVTKEKALERRGVCEACAWWRPESKACGACGCTSVKRHLASSSCPKGKWGPVRHKADRESLLKDLRKTFQARPVFIIGGGPSLGDQEQLQALCDRLRAAGGVLLGINDAYAIRGVRWTVANDNPWIEEHERRDEFNAWLRSGGRLIDINRAARKRHYTALPSEAKPSKDPAHRNTLESVGLYNNSGCAAYQIAVACKPTHIFLLGFDGTPEEGQDTNWHVNIRESSMRGDYDEFGSCFDQMMDALRSRGDELPPTYNLSPQSIYKTWPKATAQEALDMMPQRPKRLVFHHLPKSGGTSVLRTLKTAPYLQPVRIPFQSPADGAHTLKAHAGVLGPFSSHYAFSPDLFNPDDDTLYITWVRHPLAMLKSGWKYYAAADKPHRAFLPDDVGACVSAQQEQKDFASMIEWAAEDPGTRLRFPLHYFEMLAAHEHKFDFIGVAERMDEDVQRLSELLRIDLTPEHANLSKRNDLTMDAVDQLALELLAPAVEVYEHLAQAKQPACF